MKTKKRTVEKSCSSWDGDISSFIRNAKVLMSYVWTVDVTFEMYLREKMIHKLLSESHYLVTLTSVTVSLELGHSNVTYHNVTYHNVTYQLVFVTMSSYK